MLSNTKKLKAGLAAATALAAMALAVAGGRLRQLRRRRPHPRRSRHLHADRESAAARQRRADPAESGPARVKAVIAAANRIRTKPYIWGGGHASWWDRGYDCSGSVSYALHGGEFLESPLPSGPMESWGAEGEGRWITVYANAGHAYAEIAGYPLGHLRRLRGTGPRWHEELLSNDGFVARHPLGY